jgi:uncharacterized peroxidase-related enzyme
MTQASETTDTNLPLVEEDDATGTVARVYAEYRERFGRQHVPGILKCFATHPPLLEQMMALASTLLFTEGHLTRATKEMLATYVSRLNACPYCLDSHASFLREQGAEAELLRALFDLQLDSASVSDAQRSLLKFAGKITNESHRISRADVQQVQAAGWTEQQIAEAVHIVGLFAYFNRVANAFGLPSQHLYEAERQDAEETGRGRDSRNKGER